MTNHNKHIKEYLDYYLSSKFNPEFAVLLKGEWGCGKTWFIKNFLTEYFKSQKSHLYITLYGVSTINEIEDQIFQQLHPFLSSTPVTLAGKILCGALKAGLKIDFDGSSLSAESKIQDTKLKDFMTNVEDTLIVFDDFERSDMNMTKLMGYINSFVEHQQLKIIIIANEEELKAIEENENGNCGTYKKIKEKLIGKTFKISHDTDSAFDSFVEQIQKGKIKTFINKRREAIIEIFNKANYRNLRHLKQSLWDFERFYSSTPDKYLSKPELMNELLSLFLAFSFEIKKGEIVPEDINDLEGHHIRNMSRMIARENKTEEKMPPIDVILKKYSFIHSYDMILPGSLWCNLFDQGYISRNEIIASLDKSRYCSDENTPEWIKLWHFRELSDDEFTDVLGKVYKEWSERKFEDRGEILHVSGLFLALSKIGIIDKNIADVVTDCKNYIDDIKKKGNLHKYADKNKYGIIDQISSNGLGYAGKDLEEFQAIHDYLNEAIYKSKIERLPQDGKELLEILSIDPSTFGHKIYMSNTADQIYYKIPIFNFINVEDFFKIFLKLGSIGKSVVIDAMERRYEFLNPGDKLYEEIDFITAFKSLVVKRIDEKKGPISGYVLTEILPDIEKIETKLKSLNAGGNNEIMK